MSPGRLGNWGKVDQGGGGTIAYIMADWGCDVVDCGVAMHSMHAPLEIVAKSDAYSGYLAYKAFFLKANNICIPKMTDSVACDRDLLVQSVY